MCVCTYLLHTENDAASVVIKSSALDRGQHSTKLCIFLFYCCYYFEFIFVKTIHSQRIEMNSGVIIFVAMYVR